MLLKLSDKISECLAHAADARERANAAIDPRRKADLFDMELRWLRLVESYKFVEQVSRFLEDGRITRTPPAEELPKTGVLVVTCPVTGKDFSTGILIDEASLQGLPQEMNRSHCPHCSAEHPWWTKDAKFEEAIPLSRWLETAQADAAKTGAERDQIRTAPTPADNQSLADLLGPLVRTVIEYAEGKARAAFYIAEGAELHHVVGMPEAYARYVNGFAIGPQSLACGLAASARQPIITRDVAEEPRWKPWLWLAEQFDYRACWSFPVETSTGKIVGTFAIYYKEPRDATVRDLDVAATITRTAAIMMARQSTIQ